MANLHHFHIPVMGTGFTIDSPIKVAKYGISSVISLVDDILIEQARKYYSAKYNIHFQPITNDHHDPRAARITAYLDLVNRIVTSEIEALRTEPFEPGTEITKYFSLLPSDSPLRRDWQALLAETDPERRTVREEALRGAIRPGSIDVNIMTKLDKDNWKNGEKLPAEFADALAALRGFARSNCGGAIVFSAGLNRRLYTYIEQLSEFFYNEAGETSKRIILKVSDYRSAVTQGKFFAKKGLWISEFRIESGLNCGGHAFATDGFLLGPVMQEFKSRRAELIDELSSMFSKACADAGRPVPTHMPRLRITVQGGVTTASEHEFFRKQFGADSVGWGTPFLLVPEASTVDTYTREMLAKAGPDEVGMSNASPLNVIFQNLLTSRSEIARKRRIAEATPGVPCRKGFLAFNSEFSERPICTASRLYQTKKLESLAIPLDNCASSPVTDKACICHELGGSAMIAFGEATEATIDTAICPGPSIIPFTKPEYALSEMVDHVYGRADVTNGSERPHCFALELSLYLEHLRKRVAAALPTPPERELAALREFCETLGKGIEYYQGILGDFITETDARRKKMGDDFAMGKRELERILASLDASAGLQSA